MRACAAKRSSRCPAYPKQRRPTPTIGLRWRDPRDLGVALTQDISRGLKTFEPNLYLYDSYPGGVGLSAPLYKLVRRLLAGASELLASCSCEAGCPSCVGPIGEVGERGKEAAARILAELLA